jgi:LmbE family N-acetylglucosaminyl deacetylase
MPDLVYAPHERESHPDHRASLVLLRRALSVVRRNRERPQVRLFEVWTPLQRIDHVEDITEQIRDKLSAIRAYRSQCAVVNFVEAFRGLARYRGEMHCWPAGTFAEVFADPPWTAHRAPKSG